MQYFKKEYTTTANIAASATSTEAFISEADQFAYAPFDDITIINDDTVILRINLDNNSSRCIKVLPNSRESGHNLKFRSFSISNLDASTAHTAGKVHISVEQNRAPRKN